MNNVISTYAAFSKNDQLRLSSSSGALFSIFAKYILQRNGVVYGVTMSQDCQRAEYIRIDNQSDLIKLQGSKYLQAKIGNVYQQLKVDLDFGTIVLFSGTGCQINGLKEFLNKNYSNLYCIEVICHGVPSPKLWKKYVQYIEKEAAASLVGVNFRCKGGGLSKLENIETNKDHKILYESKNMNPYMQMFLKNYCLRPSCYECLAKDSKRSDITIGDFWGIEHIFPNMNDGKGISLVITRTINGQKLFDNISENIRYKNVSYKEGVRYNTAEYRSVSRPVERDSFFIDMNQMDFNLLKKKYITTNQMSIKRKIKKLILNIFLQKHTGEDNLKNEDYGLCFTFKEKHESRMKK